MSTPEYEKLGAQYELCQMTQEDFNRLIIENLYLLNEAVYRNIVMYPKTKEFIGIKYKIEAIQSVFEKYMGKYNAHS